EVGESHFERYCSSPHTRALAVVPNLLDQGTQLSSHVIKACQVSRERILRSNRLAIPIWDNRPVIDASADAVKMGSCLPKVLQQEGFILSPQIKRGEYPEVIHLRGSRGSDAMKPPHRERLDKGRPHLRRNDVETIGLAVIGSQLGEELVVRNARGCCQLGLNADLLLDLFGDLCRRCDALKIFSHIEISFVERQRLDYRRVLREYRADL